MIHLKRQLGANQLARLCAHKPIANAAVDGLLTPVAVDQRAANCLEEAVRSFSPSCGAGVDHHALTSLSVVHREFFELFSARRSAASKLASLSYCSTADELQLRDWKILLLEGR
ncbi:hypothetical protein TNCV_1629611 [Trichonephila clavipes]|uniref:Uncharacterized protein n=1 Tax=Trichonephila clavipes TaxID=2585209 RepID=A0A8X6W9X1_TRICX|nr:hypothetical protein TNCV_1629611 [Trichonephila clavipes]